ncbi:hypothetical protein EPUS_04997 [Endocarpon pusillum Z07020]|uniref:WSC domain-containing protein n=1 Tax=Endocarpon pusillum (strain Z07020 / HMAS-L-300199) TaxID=1263415 RepID=U1HSC8_ENDPU|nr:uncharacterized protein EPUS_04997 [Endocarpon pusillum Z07020]ERF72079.1 hypothetical protein EPUS_04997 [Endocarpon pusillum Z07020]
MMHHCSSPTIAFLTFLLPLLPQTAQSLQWRGPHATPTQFLPDADGWTPKPTAAPPSQHVVAAAMGNTNLELKLFRRQTGGLSKLPNTCGYVDGNGAYAFTCSGYGYVCAYNTRENAFGCCSGTSVASDGRIYFTDSCYIDTMTTGCYASTEADLCTGLCSSTAAVCLQSTAPICRTVLQFGTDAFDPATYTQYDCIPLGVSTRISLQNLFSVSISVEPDPLFDPSYTWDGTTFIPTSATTTRSTSVPVTGSGSSTVTPVPTTPGPVRPPRNNTGAIAGGVVGGLALLGLVAGGAIWGLMRRKQKARRQASAVNEVSHVTYVHDAK